MSVLQREKTEEDKLDLKHNTCPSTVVDGHVFVLHSKKIGTFYIVVFTAFYVRNRKKSAKKIFYIILSFSQVRKSLSFFEREGWRSLRRALASI